jgi:hypothetical protein
MKGKFEARARTHEPWIWDVWDITHEAECNHFILVTVDSKGAAEDFHEPVAKKIARILNEEGLNENSRV